MFNRRILEKIFGNINGDCQMKWLKYIFSIGNNADKTCKIIIFLGIKFKINKYNFLKLKKYEVQKNKIVFSNYIGNSYGCHPKYITEEILKQNLPYEIVWLVKDKNKSRSDFPKKIRLENYFSLDAAKELLTAKVWVDNTRKPFFWENGLKKKKNQMYLQTWHGSLGIKKMEGDNENEMPWWNKWAKVDSDNIDCIISNSKFLSDLYNIKTFRYSGRVDETGHPRNDIFFKKDDEKQEIIDKIYCYFNIKDDKKIILYVPTYRDDGDIAYLNLDFGLMMNIMNKKFGSDYVVLARLHPNTPVEYINNIKNVINATYYPDIQELLLASDIVISDYSSCMFDFMLTRRPVFIYASDIEKYNTDRGFYYPLETTPFPIATNNEEMIENIENFDYDKYKNEVEQFLIDKGCVDDGHASERVVEIIKNYIEGK